MNLKSERKLRLIKHGFRNRIDPRARERQIKQLLPALFEKRGWLRPRSEDFTTAIYCAAVFMQDVIVLTRLPLWRSLQNQGPPFAGPPERELTRLRQLLKGPHASMHALIAGMDIASLAVRSMISRFPAARFHPDDDWDLEETDENEPEELEDEYDEGSERQREKDFEYSRFKCAALLPVLTEIAEEVWPPLKTRIAASEPSTKDAESE
jgi:hypothetical protein